MLYFFYYNMEGQPHSSSQEKSFFPEPIQEFISLFRIPLIFGFGGIFLLILAIVILTKQATTGADVVFTTTDASSSASFMVRIDVAGAVVSPGVYELGGNNRVQDALIAAGGLSALADRDWIEKNLNKAAKLTDGGKIYIPKTGETSSRNVSNLNNPSNLLGGTIDKVNINTSSAGELEGLPGVGPVTAGKIISGRPYQTIEDLKTKKIVGNALFEKIKDRIGL